LEDRGRSKPFYHYGAPPIVASALFFSRDFAGMHQGYQRQFSVALGLGF